MFAGDPIFTQMLVLHGAIALVVWLRHCLDLCKHLVLSLASSLGTLLP
jgi:hypothetical protein